jgi:hypothetical protein
LERRKEVQMNKRWRRTMLMHEEEVDKEQGEGEGMRLGPASASAALLLLPTTARQQRRQKCDNCDRRSIQAKRVSQQANEGGRPLATLIMKFVHAL